MQDVRTPPIEALDEPLELPNGHVIPNRIAKAAMSENLAKAGGAPGERLFRVYERWGKGGAGMLLTGNVIISPEGRTEPDNVLVRDERHLDALREWVRRAEAHDSQLWMQINHSGRQAVRKVTRTPIAPSPIPVQGLGPLFAVPEKLTHDRIRELIDAYANTARVAKEAGFSGVQLHGAHGYLISQFLSPRTNERTDQWGGSPENRRRFLVEIVRTTRELVGPDFPVAVKLNSADFQRGGFSEDESMDVVEVLVDEGVDLLEVSGGNYESPEMSGVTDRDGNMRESTARREAYFLEYAEKVSQRVDIPLMLTGGLRTARTMADVVASGAVDMVGIGRPMTVEADLPARMLAGEVEAALDLTPQVGLRKVDSLLQVAWYQQQIHRMGQGLDPDPDRGALRSLFCVVWEQTLARANNGRADQYEA